MREARVPEVGIERGRVVRACHGRRVHAQISKSLVDYISTVNLGHCAVRAQARAREGGRLSAALPNGTCKLRLPRREALVIETEPVGESCGTAIVGIEGGRRSRAAMARRNASASSDSSACAASARRFLTASCASSSSVPTSRWPCATALESGVSPEMDAAFRLAWASKSTEASAA